MTASDWQLVEWWLPKLGNPVEEFEDSFDSDPASGRFAVADGATESSFAARWAQAMVQAFVRQPPGTHAGGGTAARSGAGPRDEVGGGGWPPDPTALAAWLAPLQAEWHESIPWDRLPWYGLEKAQSGAFSTLLGLEFFADATGDPGAGTHAGGGTAARSGAGPRDEVGGGGWRAISVGDSVLFQLRDDRVQLSWPVASAEQLGNRPRLLSSLPTRNVGVLEECVTIGGEARPGDRFLLMTDALAHWLLEALEVDGPAALEAVLALPDAAAFAAFVDEARGTHAMRNDDVTLVTLTVPEQLPAPVVQPALPPAASP